MSPPIKAPEHVTTVPLVEQLEPKPDVAKVAVAMNAMLKTNAPIPGLTERRGNRPLG
ncbi:MAG: hypothetical protein AAGI09_13060 [Pseudomonadota bacterium]